MYADVLKHGDVYLLFVQFGVEFECRCDLVSLLGGSSDRAALVVLEYDQFIVRGGHHWCWFVCLLGLPHRM